MTKSAIKHTAEIIILGDIRHFREQCDECYKGYVAAVSRKVYETAMCFEKLEGVVGKPSWYMAEAYEDFYREVHDYEELAFWKEVCDLLRVIHFCCPGAIKILPEEIEEEIDLDEIPF